MYKVLLRNKVYEFKSLEKARKFIQDTNGIIKYSAEARASFVPQPETKPSTSTLGVYND